MRKLLNLFGRRRMRMERELAREMQYHVERRIADLLDSGLPWEEAARRANLEFGGVTQAQEEVRETWVARWLDDLLRDLRHAARSLARNPAFALAAIVSLALGIGANTAIFSLVDQVLLRRLPVPEPERLALVWWNGEAMADGWGSGNLISYPLCRDLAAQKTFFENVGCRHGTLATLSSGQGPEPVLAEIVSGSYFPTLGVRAAAGRLLDESDDLQPGAHPVVVLSYDYWRNRLESRPDIVGSKVLVNNHPMTVAGIAQAGFRGVDLGEAPALWIPAMMKRQATPEWDRLQDRRARWMQAFARLQPGMTMERAKAGLQPWFKAMLEADARREGFPQVSPQQRRAFFASYLDIRSAANGRSNLRSVLATPLQLLMAGTSLLLLLACLNVAGLFVARGSSRSRELTTRLALGASRGRIARQLLADSLLIALAGGLLGAALAPAVSQALIALLPDDGGRISIRSEFDSRVFVFTLLVSIVSGALCAVAPALHAGRARLASALAERSSITGGGVRLRKGLVAGQMAFTLILLVAAGLFIQTLARLQTKGPGFDSGNLVTFRVNAGRSGYAPAEARRLMRTVLEKLQETPGVENAALAGMALLDGGSWNMFLVVQDEGRRITDGLVHLDRITPELFPTLGTRIVAGRAFDARDRQRSAEDNAGLRTAIVNERFVKRYFGGRSPIGHRLGLGNRPDTEAAIEIVGVVKDFSYRGLREESEQAFFPFWEDPMGNGTFYVRVRGNPQTAIASIRAAVAEVAPTLPLIALRTVDQQIARSLSTERLLASVSGGFGSVAVLLSVVGLYGVMAFVVTQRTREIGIRLALGASRATAVWMILRDALVLIAGGAALALPCVWVLSRLVGSQLYGVEPIDLPTIAGAAALLSLTALGAAWLAARRAALVSPTEALRFE